MNSSFKPVNRNGYHADMWSVFSKKINRIVNLYSTLEYDAWVHFETDPNVLEFCEQPFTAHITIDGKLHSTIFDFWIKYSDMHEELVEIKYSNKIKNLISEANNGSINQIKVQEEWCKANSYIYRILTELTIRKDVCYLTNLKRIYFSSLYFSNNTEIVNRIINHFEHLTGNRIKLKQLLMEFTEIQSFNELLSIVSELYIEGKLHLDIKNDYISSETEVYLND